MKEVLLPLDAVDTLRDTAERYRRKDLINQANTLLKRLDATNDGAPKPSSKNRKTPQRYGAVSEVFSQSNRYYDQPTGPSTTGTGLPDGTNRMY